MNELATISNATAIASNVTSMAVKLEARMDTGVTRKAANKLGYSIQTIGNARHFADALGLEGRDRDRAEHLIDAFTAVAIDDIMKCSR